MDIGHIVQALERYGPFFPRGPLREAMARREEITPALLQILRETTDNFQRMVQDGEFDDYMAHFYAMYLLSYFRETAAYPLFIAFFSVPGESIMDVTADLVTEDLGRMLASVCGGDTGPMQRLAENEEANEYVRNAALEGLLTLVVCGLKPREEVVAYFLELFHKLPRRADPIWDFLVDTSLDLYPGELAEEIDRAFQDELLADDIVDRDLVQEFLARGQEDVLAETRADHHHTLMESPIRELESWALFRPSEGTDEGTVKIGRNERCPCGSGLKYKQCCGRRY